MTAIQNLSAPLGRLLLSLIFVVSGVGKIGAYAGTQAYMDSMGVPGVLLPLVIERLKAKRAAGHPLLNRLREQLWRYYPAMLELESNLAAPWLLALWEAVPTPDRPRPRNDCRQGPQGEPHPPPRCR